jgi:hypothetical protein
MTIDELRERMEAIMHDMTPELAKQCRKEWEAKPESERGDLYTGTWLMCEKITPSEKECAATTPAEGVRYHVRLDVLVGPVRFRYV